MALNTLRAKGADTIPDIYCEPCHDLDIKLLPVAGFCQDCGKFLCTQCFTQHRLPKQSRHHQLLDKEHMPLTKPSTIQKRVEEKCPLHPSDSIRFFCRPHNQLCCSSCVEMNHPRCKIDFVAESFIATFIA